MNCYSQMCIIMKCFALVSTVMHFSALFCTILHCCALLCTVMYCCALLCTIKNCCAPELQNYWHKGTIIYFSALLCTQLHSYELLCNDVFILISVQRIVLYSRIIREQFANRFVTNLFADIQVTKRFLFLFTTISFYEYYSYSRIY